MRYSIFLIITVLLWTPLSVSADAWWGKGYRSPQWVLEHGGSIIRYNIKGTNKTHHYKAMMLRDGKYVEVEFDDHATFDDAKDGVYEIKFYKCEDSCTPHKFDRKTKIRKSDSKKATVFVTARPGETTNVVFDVRTKSAYIVGAKSLTGENALAPKTPPKPQYTQEQLIGFAAKREEGQKCDRKDLHLFTQQTFTFPVDK